MVDKTSAEQPTSSDIIDSFLLEVIELAPNLRKQLIAIANRQRECFNYTSTISSQGRSIRNEQIYADYRKGERIAYLARKYNVTERWVQQIVKQQAALFAAAGR